MNASSRKKILTFGDFVARVYGVYSKQKARRVVRLAIKAHVIEFRGQQQFDID